MKLLMIAALCFVSLFASQAQNIIDPPPLLFNFKDNAGIPHFNSSLSHSYFPLDKFIMGWQWGQHPRVTQELI